MRPREREILAVLEASGAASVAGLSTRLGVSEVTVRSDVAGLERAGLLRRTRGGVTLPLPPLEQPLEQARRLHAAAKRRIGQAAAALIQDGDTVFLDVGSTTSEVARCVSPLLRGVTVVTNGLNIALELERVPGLSVVVTGGTLRPLQHSLVSPYGLELLARFRPDLLLLGCNGVDARAGVTNSNHAEAEVKALAVAQSRRVAVLADHSKLGQVAAAAIAPLSRVALLLTDGGGGAVARTVREGLAAQIEVRAV